MNANILRTVDRAILAIISMVLILSGLYLTGPWYIPVIADSAQPIFKLLSQPQYVIAFGAAQLFFGCLLFGAALQKKINVSLLTAALFAGFVVRLYTTIGVLIALNGFLPPSYLSQVAVLAILGVYWLHVKRVGTK